MTSLDFRHIIAKNLTIKHGKVNSEDIRRECHFENRRQAAAAMKEIAEQYPSSFEYGNERNRVYLKHLGGVE